MLRASLSVRPSLRARKDPCPLQRRVRSDLPGACNCCIHYCILLAYVESERGLTGARAVCARDSPALSLSTAISRLWLCSSASPSTPHSHVSRQLLASCFCLSAHRPLAWHPPGEPRAPARRCGAPLAPYLTSSGPRKIERGAAALQSKQPSIISPMIMPPTMPVMIPIPGSWWP